MPSVPPVRQPARSKKRWALTITVVLLPVFGLTYLRANHSNLIPQVTAEKQARTATGRTPSTTIPLIASTAPTVTTVPPATTTAPSTVPVATTASPAIALTVPPIVKPTAVPLVGSVVWKRFDTAWLPYTTDGGPNVTNPDGSGSGFAFTDYGAALAAWHLLVRSDPATPPAGLREVFDSQVVGPAAETLLATTLEEHTQKAAALGRPVDGPLPRTAVVPVAYKIYVTTVPGVLAVTVISGNETGDMLEAVTVQVVLYKSDYRRVVNDYNLARLDQGPVDEIPEGFTRYPTRPGI